MAKRDKRLEKARRNPKDLSFAELVQIYEDAGFVVRSGGKGSHWVAKKLGTAVPPETFVRSNPVKVVYIERALDAIELSELYKSE